jgi:hypothetical protein
LRGDCLARSTMRRNGRRMTARTTKAANRALQWTGPASRVLVKLRVGRRGAGH